MNRMEFVTFVKWCSVKTARCRAAQQNERKHGRKTKWREKQWQVQYFPEVGAPKTYYLGEIFAENYMKMK